MHGDFERFHIEKDEYGYFAVVDRSNGLPATHRGRRLSKLNRSDADAHLDRLNAIERRHGGLPTLSPTG